MSMSSGAPDVAPRRLNSKDVHVVEKFKNSEFESYSKAQRALTKVAPRNGVGFVELREEPRRIVYRDITRSFSTARCSEVPSSKLNNSTTLSARRRPHAVCG